MYINPSVSGLMLTFNLVCWSYELLLLPFCQIKALWHQQGTATTRLLLIGYFFIFGLFSVNSFPYSGCMGKIPVGL